VPAVPPTDFALAIRDDLRRLEDLILAVKKELDRIVHDQDVQFQRIAQLQAEIDLVRGAWTKVTPERAPSKRVGIERRVTARKK